VVDDDRHTRPAIGIWLKQCGFKSAITDGGKSGLAALDYGTFDLMIVDVFMPNMRGFESIRDGKYGPNCQGIDHPAFAASSILAKRRKPPAPPPNQENQTASL
jgi:CheY-like chemotaxis protein